MIVAKRGDLKIVFRWTLEGEEEEGEEEEDQWEEDAEVEEVEEVEKEVVGDLSVTSWERYV